MRGALVIALCATGCFSDRGVAIEVDVGDTGATMVELFIGKTPCGSDTGIKCNGIEPPGAVCALNDNIWFRDDGRPFPPVNVQGRTATFRLESDIASLLPIVIAVGSNLNGDLVGTATLLELPVPANAAQVATATLVRAQQVISTQPPPPPLPKNQSVDWVRIWTNQQMPAGRCVLVEHWRPDVEVQRDSVVPASDPDCTNGVSAASLPMIQPCITPSSGPEACTLGVRLCNQDDTTIGPMCTALPKPVCVPDQLCNCTDDTGCITTSFTNPTLSSVPEIDCTIPTDATGVPCNNQPVEIQFGDTIHGSCEHPPLLALSPLGSFASSATLSGVTIELASNFEQCNFTVRAGGRFNLIDSNNTGVVKLESRAASLLLPIHFSFPTNCSVQATCMPPSNKGDRVWTCAQ